MAEALAHLSALDGLKSGKRRFAEQTGENRHRGERERFETGGEAHRKAKSAQRFSLRP